MHFNETIICILVVLVALIIINALFNNNNAMTQTEGFQQNDKFLIKSSTQTIYDNFYADIYDYLVFNSQKDAYEIGHIATNSNSKVLDVGSGTGHHVAELQQKGVDVIGIDISPAMIKISKKNYPQYKDKFILGNATDMSLFNTRTFTHITCLYFTFYYMNASEKRQFLQNAYNWLKDDGVLMLHLVDRNQFDPILPPGNPLMYVSPQKYAKQRITTTKVKFTDFSYSADFLLDEKNDKATFYEKFKNDSNGKIRKHEHTFYMPDLQTITDMADAIGFKQIDVVDMVHCQYEYQYLYIFTK